MSKAVFTISSGSRSGIWAILKQHYVLIHESFQNFSFPTGRWTLAQSQLFCGLLQVLFQDCLVLRSIHPSISSYQFPHHCLRKRSPKQDAANGMFSGMSFRAVCSVIFPLQSPFWLTFFFPMLALSSWWLATNCKWDCLWFIAGVLLATL